MRTLYTSCVKLSLPTPPPSLPYVSDRSSCSWKEGVVTSRVGSERVISRFFMDRIDDNENLTKKPSE